MSTDVRASVWPEIRMTNWYLTKKSYRGFRKEATYLCTELFGPEDITQPPSRWAFDLATAQIRFRNEADMTLFLLSFNPRIDARTNF